MPKLVQRLGDRTIHRLLAWSSIGAALLLSAFYTGRWSITPALTPLLNRLDPVGTPPHRFDWTRLPDPDFPLPPYARYLAGVKIVLDPGHVGQTDRGGEWKRGPTGLREAEANLRVASFLREFLAAAGAQVVLTRDRDEPLGLSDADDLRERAAIANRANADLFLSLHHNAVADMDAHGARANYSTIYYHQSADHSPASLCAARYLLSGLDEALRLEQHLPCALVADSTVDSPASVRSGRRGYAVLRYAECPALLIESSFHTHPREEQRLRDRVYNRREAYGLFLGLAEWARAGLPQVALREPADGRVSAGGTLTVAFADGLSARGGMAASQVKVRRGSFDVRINDQPAGFDLDLPGGLLRVPVPAALSAGRHLLQVDFQNIFGQHVLHPELEFTVAGAAAPPAATVAPPAAPPRNVSPGRSRPAKTPADPPKRSKPRRGRGG